MNFAEMSKQLRQSKNLTQKELASALKVSKACISMIEIGKNEPTANTLIRYADFFACSTDYLLGREDDFGNIVLPPADPGSLTNEEQRVLCTYRALSPENKSYVSAYLQVRFEGQRRRE